MTQLVQGLYQAKEIQCWSRQTRALPSEGIHAGPGLAHAWPLPPRGIPCEQQKLLLDLRLKFNRSYKISQIQIIFHHSARVALTFLFLLPELYIFFAIKLFHLLDGYGVNSNFKDTQLDSLLEMLVTALWTARRAWGCSFLSLSESWVSERFPSTASGSAAAARAAPSQCGDPGFQALWPDPPV